MNRVVKWGSIMLLVTVIILVTAMATAHAAREARINQPHPNYVESVAGRRITNDHATWLTHASRTLIP